VALKLQVKTLELASGRRFTRPSSTEYHPKSIAEGGYYMTATINGRPQAIQPGERLIDLINRCEIEVPHVCCHPQLGPIQSCNNGRGCER
jgi:hypothetical protein